MNKTQKISWVKNKAYSPTDDKIQFTDFSIETIESALQFQRTHPLYNNTPLVCLENLARYLHLSDIKVKDESHRFGLNAFKVMGGIYAIGKYLANKLSVNLSELSFEKLHSAEVRATLGEITFITATDGNHGKGVAWAARELGQKSVVYLPKGSSLARLEAIRKEGAQSDITDKNYDETVRMCAELAEENGWVLVQDTAWDGYEDIPHWIMKGYAAIAKEIIDEIEEKGESPPTHIFLQAGVGSFAAGIATYFTNYYREQAPKIIIVEPDLANCYYQSFASESGERKIVTGDMNSIMAGLCCGEPNTEAFKLLSHHAWGSFTCADSLAALGMRVLGNPLRGDPKIISGESGAIPLGLLFHLRTAGHEEVCQDLLLDESSRVLFINTEGDTDKQHYLDVVWKGFYSNEFM